MPDGEFVDEIQEQDSIPLLVFEKGDWTESKKVRKSLGIEDSEDGSGKKKRREVNKNFYLSNMLKLGT